MTFNKIVDTISQHYLLNYGTLIMKKLAFLLLASLSAPVFADPTVFKMELGKTTESEVKEMYSSTLKGANRYVDGNQYDIDIKEIDFDGLKSTEVVFNQQGVLVGVMSILVESAPMKHGRFSHIYGILNNKYKLVKKETPFVGDQLAIFKDGNTEIRLSAAHMGNFKIYLEYTHNELLDAYKKRSMEDKKAKDKKDAESL